MHMNLQHMRFDKSNFLCFLKKRGLLVRRPTRSAATRRRRLEVWQMTNLATVNEFPIVLSFVSSSRSPFFQWRYRVTEMQHFSFYKFKKLPASICLGIWDQIVKVVRWLQNKSSVELSSEYHLVQSCDFYSTTGNLFFSLIQVSYPKWLSICMFNCS